MNRLLLPFLFAIPLLAQTVAWDSSGNNLLNGDYRFREVTWRPSLADPTQLAEASGTYGIIHFDGINNYTVIAKQFSSVTNQTTDVGYSNTYAISQSGLGFIRRPNPSGGQIEGMISGDVFIGSSTEKQINNLFVATRIGNSPMTTAAFNQSYTLAAMDVHLPSLGQTRDVLFAIQGNGAGTLGSLSLTGQVAVDLSTTSQSITGSTYSFSGGVGLLNFNASAGATTLISGVKEMYVSPDGAFVFGGATNGWDIFVGLRTPTAPVAPTVFDYLYDQAAFEVFRSDSRSSFILDSYYGAFTPRGSALIGHQRILEAPVTDPFNYTYSDTVNLAANGIQTDFQGYRHLLSSDGRFRVGVGEQSIIGINVSMKAPVLTGSGVFLNQVGVVNAAGFTPYTVGISPGEVITLFGTGIAETVSVDPTFPLTLNGLQVRINGILAPVYKTSAGEVSVVVPYNVTDGGQKVAAIQVFRNGVASNLITAYLNIDTPALFTFSENGLGDAASRHPDFSLITPQNPARPGEIVLLFASGLGPTSPPVIAGTPAPSDVFSVTTSQIHVQIDGREAEIFYHGLAPTLGGLYQLNVRIPPETLPGEVFVQIVEPSTTTNQATLPIGLPLP